MNIRGIALEAEQTTVCLLKQIMEPILSPQFYWYLRIDQEEVWSRPDERPFFAKEVYTADELAQVICDDHFVIFVRLEAYPKIEDIVDFSSFSEYTQSNCQIVLLIYDCEQIRIYIKDVELAKQAFEYYKNKFRNVRYITDTNDSRRGMNIM